MITSDTLYLFKFSIKEKCLCPGIRNFNTVLITIVCFFNELVMFCMLNFAIQNPWSQYFEDKKLNNLILQDLDRLYVIYCRFCLLLMYLVLTKIGILAYYIMHNIIFFSFPDFLVCIIFNQRK